MENSCIKFTPDGLTLCNHGLKNRDVVTQLSSQALGENSDPYSYAGKTQSNDYQVRSEISVYNY